jgi:hypothetical protein
MMVALVPDHVLEGRGSGGRNGDSSPGLLPAAP